MLLREIIEADKKVTSYGTWERGTIPRASFPLRKKKMQQSQEWYWRIIEFKALDNDFIILIRVNERIQEYYAYLGHKRDDGMAVLCSHDLHVSHKNWHCHFIKGDVTRVETGYLRDREHMIYHPSGGVEIECTTAFTINLSNAVKHAAVRFRFQEPEQSELFA
ncbi:MAG: hypothetical protein GJ679_06080 [Rhodobacteraceae bacterium]|jgi:hypothetical protein|uniref:hypothetical protein n=1 Tax=Roseovarius sp. 10 TaxID=3080563 RepID=UPI0019379A49|nr:hypothetical protein [Roseovarius sp. 10]MBE1289559.1 hypothetical protein [Paracoccaceae bacterium]MDV7200710.1 hypothetical protein [Roseovarius sp. 10]QPI85386.1 hypothetical protein I3V23_12725 [Rhodobacterales bacterium HKCCA1288]